MSPGEEGEPAHLCETSGSKTHLSILEPQRLKGGGVQLLTAAPCLDHLLAHKGGDKAVKLPHRRPFWHLCRQKAAKETSDLALPSLSWHV